MKTQLITLVLICLSSSAIGQSGYVANTNGFIQINGAEVSCRYMDNQGILNNNGVLSVQSDFVSEGSYLGNGSVILESTDITEIYCEDTINVLVVNKPGTNISVPGNLFVRSGLDLQNGVLDMEGQSIHLGSPSIKALIEGDGLLSYVYNGPMRIHYPYEGDLRFLMGIDEPMPLEIDIVLSDTLSHWVDVQLFGGNHPDMPASGDVLNAHWIVETDNPSTVIFDAQVVYPESYVIGDEADYYLQSFETPNWQGPDSSGADLIVGNQASDQSTNTILWQNGTQLADFAIFGRNFCLGDLNGSNTVDTSDLLEFLGSIGCMSACGLADLNGDSAVDTSDLLIMLGAFGSDCGS